MPHIDEVKLLRKRARSFLSRAFDGLNSSDYDLAAFLSEQAVQLHLKSILPEKIGDFPRTHSALISVLKRLPYFRNLLEFLEGKIEIRLLEEEYIASSFFREHTEEEAEILVNLAEEVLRYGGLC
ncbi:MAG: HEPN domain-containing protein [Candidatus Methanodesulfokora sp.]